MELINYFPYQQRKIFLQQKVVVIDFVVHTTQNQGFGTGSGVFACFGSGSGSGSGFQNSLDPNPVSARIRVGFWTKKGCGKGFKSDLSDENLKLLTKDRQKMKTATISY